MPGGIVDTVKSAIFWGPVTAFLYARWAAGSLLAVPPALLHVLLGRSNITSDFSNLFDLMKGLPLGKYAFSGLAAAFTPNNAFYAAVITDLTPGKCDAYQPDYPWYRNPFGCMHAVAIISLGELVSGVAIMSNLQRTPELRAIPVKIEAKYHQKLRGTAYATANPNLDDITSNGQRAFITPIRNEKNELCAEVTVTWDFKMKVLDDNKGK